MNFDCFWLYKAYCFYLYLHFRKNKEYLINVQNILIQETLGIALNLQHTFGRMTTFTVLILPIHEHRKTFHLLIISIFFFSVKFYYTIFFTSLNFLVCCIVSLSSLILLILICAPSPSSPFSSLCLLIWLEGGYSGQGSTLPQTCSPSLSQIKSILDASLMNMQYKKHNFTCPFKFYISFQYMNLYRY